MKQFSFHSQMVFSSVSVDSLYLPGKMIHFSPKGFLLSLVRYCCCWPPLMPCCSALCLSSQSGSIAPPTTSPFLPEINGHCEQNRAVPRENAPEENICQSFGAKSNCRPIPSCHDLLPLTSACQTLAAKLENRALLKQLI